MAGSVTLSDINLKTREAISDQKNLEETYMNLKQTMQKITVTDTKQAVITNKKMYKDLQEATKINAQIENYRS